MLPPSNRIAQCCLLAVALVVAAGCASSARLPVSAGTGPDPTLPPPNRALIPTGHVGAGRGGTFFVRIAIAPEHDVAVVVASNSGEAAAATREAIESLLAQAL